MATLLVTQLRTFNYGGSTPRYLYYQVLFTVNGSVPSPGIWLGTLFVTTTPVGVANPFTVYQQKVWSGRVGIAGILLPSLATMQQIYGGTAPTSIACAIAMSFRQSALPGTLGFTDSVNLGGAP